MQGVVEDAFRMARGSLVKTRRIVVATMKWQNDEWYAEWPTIAPILVNLINWGECKG